MKGIKITEKNYRDVFSRLEKFFAHEDFIVWHTFGGGMRKRFNSKIYVSNPITGEDDLFDTKHNYYCVKAETRDCSDLFPKEKERLCVCMSDEEGFSVKIGDEVLFAGNRVIFKKDFKRYYYINEKLVEHKTYYYQCFQINSRIHGKE